MGVITKEEILRRIKDENLIRNPNRDDSGNILIESSSYDLCVGTIVWKDGSTKDTKTIHLDPTIANGPQLHTTLHPGQMLLVVTKEDIKMPVDLSATVFSRNKIARDGILALNAGHVDPGYEGPIIIRLINLRAIPYTLYLGAPIYTIVFQKLDVPIRDYMKHPAVSREESIAKATNSVNEALSNALYDLALLNNFVKKDDFGKECKKWLQSTLLGWLSIVFVILGAVVTIVKLSEFTGLTNLLSDIFKNTDGIKK
jgi:deoxycytidine triphosphate deaminase